MHKTSAVSLFWAVLLFVGCGKSDQGVAARRQAPEAPQEATEDSRAAAADSSPFQVVIRAADDPWLPVTRATGFFGGPSWQTPGFLVDYENKGLRGKAAILVRELVASDVSDGSELTFSNSSERDLVEAKGQLIAQWMDPMGTRSFSGQGKLRVYLKDKDTEEVISNVLSIPIAFDASAREELEAKFGSALILPTKRKPTVSRAHHSRSIIVRRESGDQQVFDQLLGFFGPPGGDGHDALAGVAADDVDAAEVDLGILEAAHHPG